MDDGTLTVKTLDVGTTNSVLDMSDNAMIIDYTGSSPIETIKSLITSGYANGAWTGDGINSSTAANDPNDETAVGYAEATQLFTTFPATFAGQTVDNTSVLVRYTLYGDIFLDRNVNLADFNRLADNFGMTSGAVWAQGDFNFNGSINLQDFNLLAGNFGQSLDPGDGGEGFGGGGEEYTYEDLLAILMQMYPELF